MSRGQRAPSQRQLRVGEELRHAIANILERGDIRDVDVAGRPVTVTEVSVSPDLRNATVFVIPLGGGENASLLAGLKRVRPYLRHEVARMVQMRMVPDLSFVADTTFDNASRIEALLHSPEVRRDLGEEPAEDGETRTESDEGQDDGA
ncbi:30S ribosome-binding factor RbfA [Telmatospirillum siberiense]|uniref:Ribosome-binding factor A n=1 Tax=Telmatospirillum siberiense TaxID=382514 RepID=A0A2N3PSF6_9PROT|nr:30S ribosome-binding factor RbfA [Telmatospirillum siberiense]PKU23335.1 30S ribosome-binding factor RbfA [Telmatospirillum siberiense]